MSKPNPARINIKEIVQKLELTESELKEKVILKQKGEVFYLVLNNKINAFTHEFIRTINEKLDIVEQNEGPTALVSLGLSEKFFSTGIFLKLFMSMSKIETYNFLQEFQMLFQRFLQLSVPSISLINGHAFAGGLMYAFGHDYVFMRNDFGNLCLTEIELGMYLPPGFNAVIQQRTGNTKEYREMVLQAKRFTPADGLKHGWLDGIVDPEKIFDHVSQYAQKIAKFGENKSNYRKLKLEMNKYALKQYDVGHYDFNPNSQLFTPNAKL